MLHEAPFQFLASQTHFPECGSHNAPFWQTEVHAATAGASLLFVIWGFVLGSTASQVWPGEELGRVELVADEAEGWVAVRPSEEGAEVGDLEEESEASFFAGEGVVGSGSSDPMWPPPAAKGGVVQSAPEYPPTQTQCGMPPAAWGIRIRINSQELFRFYILEQLPRVLPPQATGAPGHWAATLVSNRFLNSGICSVTRTAIAAAPSWRALANRSRHNRTAEANAMTTTVIHWLWTRKT